MRLTLALAILPLPVFADALLDRYIAAQEGLTFPLRTMLKTCAPETVDAVPGSVVTPEIRAASQCILDAHGDGAEGLVAELEAVGDGTYVSFAEMTAAAGPIMRSDEAMAISSNCGMPSASRDGPMAGFIKDNMDAMMVCFQ